MDPIDELFQDRIEAPPTKYANPVGYVAGGNLDFKSRPRPRPPKKSSKSLCVAYFLWLIGGWFALHLFYLGRDRQAYVWLTSFGGYFGCGLLIDFFRIPSYVRDYNEGDAYMENLTAKMRKHKKPPLSVLRLVGQVLVGSSWGYFMTSAVPMEQIFGLNLHFLVYLSPVGTALAVWMIGNIGREQGKIKWAMAGAFLPLPFAIFHPPFLNFSSVVSTVLFTWKGKEWRRTPYPSMPFCKRFLSLCLCGLVWSSLWCSFLYFNATVTDSQNEKIKLRDAAKNFVNSPLYQEFKRNLRLLYEAVQEHGWTAGWVNFIEMLDPLGEIHALKVLNLEKGATQEQITATYRKLAKAWHPDRQENKEEAQSKFIEIQQAYEKLSSIKARRKAKSKKAVAEESP